MKTGVLLINLGTPDDPTPRSVARFLREFLMDPYVIDIPAPLRWILVNGVIAPRRSRTSAEAYRKIWTERGSPLKFHTLDLRDRVAEFLGPDFIVQAAMRYQNPSIRLALEVFRLEGVSEVRVLPLYPQYTWAANRSSEESVKRAAQELGVSFSLKFLPPFYDNPGFIEAFRERIATQIGTQTVDHLLFSYHGLPERQIRKASTGDHCFTSTSCCDRICPQNEKACYRAHCYETSRLLAQALGLPPERWSVAFQSRLGRDPWIKPYTDIVFNELADKGVKNLVVACPAFTADCLETLEEIDIRGKIQFLERGGESLVLVLSLNSEPSWVRAIAGWVQLPG